MSLYQRLDDGDTSEVPEGFAAGPAFQDHAPLTPAALAGMRWDPAPDLERWLSSFYQYFELKGFRGVLSVNIFHCAALTFTFAFSFTVFFFVDWEAILSCDSEESCRHVGFLYARPFAEIGRSRSLVLLFFFLFFAFWLFNMGNTYHTLRDSADMRHYYKERLGILSDDILATMEWSEVVSRLVQQQHVTPFCVVQDDITALEIANIIMREDNFVISLTNHGAFTSRLPPWIPPRLVYTRAVQGCLRTAIFRWAFDSRSRLSEEFLTCPRKLASRLRYMGVLTLLLVLPVLIFVTLVFFMRHAEEFRSHRTSPFRREWTDYGKWTFREFNELRHQFKERMRSAQLVAENYVQATRPPTPLRDSLQRFVKFVAGSVLAVLLIVALWDDTPLFFVKIMDKNLLWYLAFFGFLFAVADNAEDGSQNQSQTLVSGAPLVMHTEMMRLARCTHFLPASWRPPAPLAAMAGGCSGAQRARLCQHFGHIRAEFLGDFFVHRIQALAEELVGVVLAPLLLIVYLPEAAPDIVDVIRRSRHASERLGDFCVFGCLDPARSGSEFYGGPAWQNSAASSGTDSAPPTGSLTAGGRGARSVENRIVSHGGKLEKSVISFILSHRTPWSPSTLSDGFWDSHPAYQGPRLSDVSTPASGSRSMTSPGPRQLAQAMKTFTRSSVRDSSANTAAIPMKDLSASGQQQTASELQGAAEGQEQRLEEGGGGGGLAFPERTLANGFSHIPVWGYPVAALALLHELEDFQQRETGASSSQHRLYTLFPDELVALERATSEVGGEPLPLAAMPVAGLSGSVKAGPLDGQVGRTSCSSHFFWLEVLYDFYSGRHASHLGDAGGGATFELLEQRPGEDAS